MEYGGLFICSPVSPGEGSPLVPNDTQTAVLLLFTAVLSAVLSGKTEGAKAEWEEAEEGKGQRGAELYQDCLYTSFAKRD